jgi:hypothetical protein
MCARRFLAIVFVLTLLAVVLGFALFQWGAKALLSQATPTGHFELAEAGADPDYRKAESWLARPGMPEDPSGWLPQGVEKGVGDAAIFYIHPTTYLERDRWNAPLLTDGETEFRTRLFVQSQASAFNAAGEIWAPRYRQAAYGAFLLKGDDAQKALDLAYSDVRRAFGEFLSNVRFDRPIILAAHSQGALHLARLLQRKDFGLEGRTIAAYVVGWPISTTADLPELAMPACRTPDQTACILSWMTFGQPANSTLILGGWEDTPGLNGKARRTNEVLCVNPVTGSQDGRSAPRDNPGTLVPSADLTSAALRLGLVGATCREGLLLIDDDIPAFIPPPILGNNFHVYDYALFWAAIRRDAARRLAAWRAR